jgi:hypothetical protein
MCTVSVRMHVPHVALPAVAFAGSTDVEGLVAVATVGHALLAADAAGVGALGLADVALTLADSVGEFAISRPLLLLGRNRERNCICRCRILNSSNRRILLHRASDHPTRYFVNVVLNLDQHQSRLVNA